MYSDRLAGKRALRPALDTSSRLFQHIVREHTDNQEDRRLYEEASVQLYDATPNANVAKRHGVLKAKINGKMPQPWMSMTRQVNVSSAAGPEAAACHQSSCQLSLTGSASPEASSAAEGIIPPRHHAQSADSVPYSEGLFGRQRAAKRKSAPAAPPPHQHSGSTANRQQVTKSFKLSSPDVEHHHQMSQAAQLALAALDRAPPRGSLRADQRPHAQLSRRQEAQRPLDALDLFNMRHKAPDVRAEASTHGAATEYQQPAQQAQMVVDQPILDGLDRFNARKGRSKAAGVANSITVAGTSTHILIDAKMQVAGEAASGSDQADVNDHNKREAAGLQAREQGSAVSKGFASGLRSAAAWQDGAQTAYRGSYQGFGTAGGQRALVPQHKRMRAFDSDIGVECEQSLNVVRRNGPISAGGGRVCPEHVAQIGTVFKRLG
ncbi:MAG: hypothetical protein FRX49_11919 [Trebouxia sp. A1-2]|nr:MAG: hypothetical protein FRX49_11919 [Trebouxia sp. A1-2]